MDQVLVALHRLREFWFFWFFWLFWFLQWFFDVFFRYLGKIWIFYFPLTVFRVSLRGRQTTPQRPPENPTQQPSRDPVLL